MLIEVLYENLYHEEVMNELKRDDEKKIENIRHKKALINISNKEMELDME